MPHHAFKIPKIPSIIMHFLFLVMMLPSCVFILEFGFPSECLNHSTPRTLLLWYLLPPAVLAGGSYGFQSAQHTTRVRATQSQEEANQQAAQVLRERQTREAAAKAEASIKHDQFTLEVMGLGLSLEKFRNAQVWDRIVESNHQGCILPVDPKAYPWSKGEKYQVFQKRCQDALTQAADWFTEHWAMPLFLAGPELKNTKYRGHLDSPMSEKRLKGDEGDQYPLIGDFTDARMETGMESHPFTVMQIYHSADPAQVLPDVFTFFDTHPEVPAVMVYALDSLSGRSLLRDFGLAEDSVKDGYRQPGELTESITGLVLARRDRVEAMRAFAQQETSSRASRGQARAQGQPRFQPTEYLPRPWDKWQLIQFDRLPVLGRIHRPKTVSYLRPDGSPMKPAERQAAFAAGWKAALGTLPEGQRPARVLYDHGPASQGARLAPLHLALHQLGPELDMDKDGIDLHTCLGDLGADAAFVNAAVGVYASHRRNDISACVSLRQEHGALILMVSPPAAKERNIPHPGGKDHVNMHDSYGVEPYGWLPAVERPKGMLVHSAYRIED